MSVSLAARCATRYYLRIVGVDYLGREWSTEVAGSDTDPRAVHAAHHEYERMRAAERGTGSHPFFARWTIEVVEGRSPPPSAT